ncbi:MULTISPECIES: hypothetical protein [unclassified Breznakia]|uniref:hypothetical protein n=1 Tax=unclassified Breznakia TaxID=2623764 RepID=UPI002474B730|nr:MULTISPECIES: hypothetical protein [unclassified Breznakia]MDH6366902.1 hypothetical protein [Breznakia sp. PH1-1]MDH6404080.1 hypothetical protein [Breznakia sp. PF1-11]MDH6411698.1 hypothetical protein [Breznakia sp. PFB1-11]MDH6414068.1 hypothetical protein [Breznakia sp. PFB1-14]MDH6416498.1 hypothetical protein [Breznakia sp. PFB1-4]
MQSKEIRDIADDVMLELETAFEKIGKDYILEIYEESIQHGRFQIEFNAYNYYICVMTYDGGIFGCSIKQGSSYLNLDSKSIWFEKIELSSFFCDLKDELELRIPDKYLISKEYR